MIFCPPGFQCDVSINGACSIFVPTLGYASCFFVMNGPSFLTATASVHLLTPPSTP